MVKNATIKQIHVYTLKNKTHEKDKYIDMIN